MTFLLQDGRIDYGEFAAMMRKGDGEVGRCQTMKNNLNFSLADAFGVNEQPTTVNESTTEATTDWDQIFYIAGKRYYQKKKKKAKVATGESLSSYWLH